MNKYFGIDLRSLAAFRIAFGLLLIGDLLVRALYLKAHYTDYGVMPRDAVTRSMADPYNFSLFLVNGSTAGTSALFLFALLAYFCFAAGYYTKIATFISWIFLVSLQNRNHLVLQGGDELARGMLFWCLFLPMGRTISVDYYLATKEKTPKTKQNYDYVSLASFAVILQLALLYFFAGILKDGPEWTVNGTAIYYALNIEEYVKPFGQWQLNFLPFLTWSTFATRYFEIIGPIFFFAPWPLVRILVFFIFAGFQTGLFLSLELGIFPPINIVCLIPLLPGAFWEWLGNNRIKPIQIFLPSAHSALGPFLSFFEKMPTIKIEFNTHKKWASGISTALVAFFICYVTLWNFQTASQWNISFPQQLEWIGQVTRIDQMWNLFAPFPYKEGGYFVIPGYLENGKEVDAYNDKENAPSWEAPPLISATYPTDRERTLMMNLWLERYADDRIYLAEYLCRRWNDSHLDLPLMKNIDIYFMARTTLLDNKKTEPKKMLLWQGACPSGSI